MSKKIIILLVAASIALPAIASAAENNTGRFYGRADVGYGMTKHKLEATDTATNKTESFKVSGKGMLGSIGIGYYAAKEVRTELQLYMDDGLQGKKSGVKIKEKTIAGFVNAFYDFHNSSGFTPYIMGGIGYSSNKYKTNLIWSNSAKEVSFKKKKAFVYQIGVGGSYAVSKNMHFDLGYRLMFKNNAKHKAEVHDKNNTISAHIKRELSHTFLAGVRVTF